MLPLIWIGVVLAFTGYGFFGAYAEARQLQFTLEPSIGYGAMGVGVATCGVIGLAVISGVRSGWLGKAAGGFLLAISLVLSTVLPFIIISPVQSATRARGLPAGIHLFQGEHSWWLLQAPLYTLMIAGCASIIFAIFLVTARRPDRAAPLPSQ